MWTNAIATNQFLCLRLSLEIVYTDVVPSIFLFLFFFLSFSPIISNVLDTNVLTGKGGMDIGESQMILTE